MLIYIFLRALIGIWEDFLSCLYVNQTHEK